MRELVLDVSRHDGEVDFDAWRDEHGLWGVIIKAGGSDVGRYEDRMFRDHYEAAAAAGLHIGCYYYSAATDPDEAAKDGIHFASIVKRLSLDLPCYMDVEEPDQLGLNMRELTDTCNAFNNEMRAAGRYAGIYSGYDGLNNMFLSELGTCALWVAAWRASWPLWASDYGMWQQGSMRLSDGAVYYDDVDGCVDLDWCQVDYPAIIGQYLVVQQPISTATTRRVLTYADAAAEVMDQIIDDDSFGYSQPNRAGDGTFKVLVLSDGTKATVRGGDKDCSELIRTCYAAVEILPFDYWDSYMWTGNERELLSEYGFVEVDKWSPERGDVLWVSGHTEMYLGGGMCGGARGDEYGGITGPMPGDQTGFEIMRREYYAGNWSSCWRYVGPERTGGGQLEDEMYCTIHLNGDKTSDGRPLPMVYFDGQALHPIAHQDELDAIRKLYSATHNGASLPDVTLGDQENPYGSRLVALLKRTVWPYADPNEDLKGLV